MLSVVGNKYYASSSYGNDFYQLRIDLLSSKLKSSLTKRKYLDDFRPFSTNISLSVYSILKDSLLRSLLLPSSKISFEYNKFLAERLENENSGPDFDWKSSINENMKTFTPTFRRFFTVYSLKMLTEGVLQEFLSPKGLDKLTKNVKKSLIRKTEKFGRVLASQRIALTYFRSNVIISFSFYLYDVGDILYTFLFNRNANNSVARLLSLVSWKFFRCSASLIFQSLGYAIGSYFSQEYGGVLVATALDLQGNVILDSLSPFE